MNHIQMFHSFQHHLLQLTVLANLVAIAPLLAENKFSVLGSSGTSKTITVGQGDYKGDSNATIQKAIDDLAATNGGTVVVPAGTYWMQDALHLRSGVHVVGKPGAILKKVPSVSSPLLDYVGYGHYEFTVRDPEKFRVGMGIHVLDDNAVGFYTTVGTITERKGELFFIDRMFNHDYVPSANARVVSVFSLVEAWKVNDASIEGLTLDGNRSKEKFELNGCRGGGIFLLESQRIAIRDVEVTEYRGDAISFQQCADILVEGCRLHHNNGSGLHPGSGTVRYVMRRVQSHHNGRSGVFYCLRTTHSRLEDCDLHDNGAVGISIGERDTDHLISGNRIYANSGAGVEFREMIRRGGDRVILRKNEIGPNCAKKGDAEVVIPAGLQDVLIDACRFTTKKRSVQIAAHCQRIFLTANTIDGKPLTRKEAGVASEEVGFELPTAFPPVGPDALPSDGAHHLDWESLPPWREPVTQGKEVR